MSAPLHLRLSRRAVPALVTAAFVVLAGCARSTSIVNAWRDAAYAAPPLQNVLVVAVKKDAARRRMWEDGLAGELSKYGVQATPSYRLFPAAVPDTQQVLGAIGENRYDGVLVSHRLGESTETRYVPGYTTTEPVWVRSRWSGRYYQYYQEVYHPGYRETERSVRYQADLWATAGEGRLIWTGTTRTIDPESTERVNQEIARIIAPDLAKHGFVPPKR